MKDFFTRYRESRKHSYVMPAIFGVLFSFAIVANYTGTDIDLRSIQANVLEANTPKIQYDADLLLERNAGALTMRIGKDAENVENLYFTILGDPSVLTYLTTLEKDITIIGNEPGIFLVKITLGKSLKAGDIIAHFDSSLKADSPFALIDAGFVSSGVSYTLSVKTE